MSASARAFEEAEESITATSGISGIIYQRRLAPAARARAAPLECRQACPAPLGRARSRGAPARARAGMAKSPAYGVARHHANAAT